MVELLYKLKVSSVGCYIGNVFLGSLGYTDDVCLLSPNRGSMRIMLKILVKNMTLCLTRARLIL